MILRPRTFIALCFALAASAAAFAQKPSDDATPAWQAWKAHEQLESESLFQGLKWRSIGPTVQGGRVVEVASIPGQPYGFYVAYATGGVWKTANNGVSFIPLSDQMPTMVTAVSR